MASASDDWDNFKKYAVIIGSVLAALALAYLGFKYGKIFPALKKLGGKCSNSTIPPAFHSRIIT